MSSTFWTWLPSTIRVWSAPESRASCSAASLVSSTMIDVAVSARRHWTPM
jgi:hypothetical protein